MPHTLPDGVVSGVLKSPWASNQASPRRIPGRALRMPAMAPAWVVQSPPRTSRRASSPPWTRPVWTWVARRPRYSTMRSRFFARGSSWRPAGVVGRVSMVEPRDARQRRTAPRAGRAGRAGGARSGWRSIPAKWPPSAVGEPAITMVGIGHVAQDTGIGGGRPSAIMAVMRIADFALERYFARWEFAVEHVLCASDVQGYPMAELIALADPRRGRCGMGCSRLHRVDRPSAPAAARSRRLYDGLDPDDVLVFAGAEEGIFCLANVILGPGDHAIVTWPGYQSLYEVARATGADVTLHELREDAGWRSTSTCFDASSRRRRGLSSSMPRTTRPGCCPIARRSTPSLRLPRRAAPTFSSTRSTASWSSMRRIACRPVPTRRRAGSRSASCRSRSRWPACGSGGWRHATATCWPGAPHSRTTRRSAPRRRPRCWRRSGCAPATRSLLGRARSSAANLERLDAFFDDWADRFT